MICFGIAILLIASASLLELWQTYHVWVALVEEERGRP